MSVPEIVSKKKIRQFRHKTARHFSDHDFLFKWSANQIAERLKDLQKEFPVTVHMGARLPDLKPHIKGLQTYIICDLSDKMCPEDGINVSADEEYLPFARHCLDLIVSALNLQAVNDVPGALVQARQALKPDGFFLACLFGGETLHELRHSLMQAELEIKGGASPRILPFADLQDAAALMQRAGFALPVVDTERITVTYESFDKMLGDLRGMGESAAFMQSGAPLTRKTLTRAEEIYRETFAEKDGRLPATFDIIFLAGWSPSEHQQKPLKPGSATKSLADALETQEIPAGDHSAP